LNCCVFIVMIEYSCNNVQNRCNIQSVYWQYFQRRGLRGHNTLNCKYWNTEGNHPHNLI